MDIDLVYLSKTGNTEKIARAIAREFKIKPITPKQAKKLKYGLVIIGSPTHGMKPAQDIVDFIEQLDAKYAAVFSTCIKMSCTGWMEKKLESLGINVIGRFSCPGETKLLSNRLVLNSGRPDVNDISEAKHFAKLMKNKLENLRL